MSDVRPLGGLKVADFAWVIAGPRVGRALADYGATVVRIESSHRVETARVVGPFHGGVFGAENSALYGNANAGKLGIALDLAKEDAREVARDLVRWADVVVEAYAPGVMGRFGFAYETVRDLNPSVVMLSSCLMGQTGPWATYAGYGQAGASLSGFQNLVGWPDRPPVGPFGPYTDYIGPRFSLVALLAALDHRRRTGEGCHIDHSQAESGMNFLAPEFVDHFASGRVIAYDGNRDREFVPHGVYRCADEDGRERWVALAVRGEGDWARLSEIDGLELGGFGNSYADRRSSEERIDGVFSGWMASRSVAEALAVLRSAGIPCHLAASSEDMAVDEQLVADGHFRRLEHPLHGETVVEGSRFRLSGTPAAINRAAPIYGQDNEHVLREILEYDDVRIRSLIESGSLE